MIKKSWLTLGILTLAPLSMALMVSCGFYQIATPPSRGQNGGNNEGSNNDNSDTNHSSVDEMPDWKLEYTFMGFKKQWEYIKDIPNVVKRLNPSEANYPEIINPKIVEKYKEAQKALGLKLLTTTSPLKEDGFLKVLGEKYDTLPRGAQSDVEELMDSRERLFNTPEKSGIGLFDLVTLEIGVFYFSHLHQLRTMTRYIGYQIALFSIDNSNELVLEQAKTNLESAMVSFKGAINDYLNPRNHLSLLEKTFGNWEDANLKEFYGEMIGLANDELSPLAIKLGFENEGILSEAAYQPLIKKHILPFFLGSQWKINYSENEINNFWTTFKEIAKRKYGWKGSDL